MSLKIRKLKHSAPESTVLLQKGNNSPIIRNAVETLTLHDILIQKISIKQVLQSDSLGYSLK